MDALQILTTWIVVGITRALLLASIAVCNLVILTVATVTAVTVLCSAVTYRISACRQNTQEQGTP